MADTHAALGRYTLPVGPCAMKLVKKITLGLLLLLGVSLCVGGLLAMRFDVRVRFLLSEFSGVEAWIDRGHLEIGAYRGFELYWTTPEQSITVFQGLPGTLRLRYRLDPPFQWAWLTMPLWLPVGLLVGLSVLLIRRDPSGRYLRKRRNQCLTCGYDLRGNRSGICPECGTPCRPREAENPNSALENR